MIVRNTIEQDLYVRNQPTNIQQVELDIGASSTTAHGVEVSSEAMCWSRNSPRATWVSLRELHDSNMIAVFCELMSELSCSPKYNAMEKNLYLFSSFYFWSTLDIAISSINIDRQHIFNICSINNAKKMQYYFNMC